MKWLMTTTSQKQKMPVFTVEDCLQCKVKTKRPFRAGDYVYSQGGECKNCKAPHTLVTMIYVESTPS